MSRLNLTLDRDTSERLERHAKKTGVAKASLARQVLREGLERREARERARKLAADYAAGRADARAILDDFEHLELELLEGDPE
jgi:hypothetical protein